MRVTISEPIRVYALGFLPLKGFNYEGYHKGWVLVKREYFLAFLGRGVSHRLFSGSTRAFILGGVPSKLQ